jgi:putative Holliday junction resolvase
LDVGKKRVGVAASDPLGLIAQPVETISRKPHGLFLEKIQSLAKELGADLVVIGLPRRTDGRLGPEAQAAMALAHEIKTKLGLETATFDERLTTVLASRILTEAGLGTEAKKKAVDQAAAALILTGYLDKQKAGAAEGQIAPPDSGDGI